MNRERVTISIRKDLLGAIDKRIDGVKMRNRSHAIESILSETFGLNSIKDVIIMTGGDDAIKNIDAIKKIIIKLKQFGVDQIIVALGFLGEKIKKELANGQKLGVEISYLENGQGSGGSLNLLKNALNKTFIVVNISKNTDIDFKSFQEFHRNNQKIVSIATDNIQNLKGIYLIEPAFLKLVPKNFSIIEEDIFPELIKKGEVAIYPLIENK